MPTALITGITGQDGSYLAEFLLSKGYKIVGMSRRTSTLNFERIAHFQDDITLIQGDLHDQSSLVSILEEFEPDEVYNLAGQSSVGLSFEQPVEAMESIAIGTLNFLEAIRFTERPIRFYNAGSGECFGDAGDTAATENTPFRPRSPYAVAKASARPARPLATARAGRVRRTARRVPPDR